MPKDNDNINTNSMELVVDFTEVVSFEPVPKGWYGITVVEAKGGTSKAGNRKVSLQLEIVSGDDPAAIGRKLFDDLVLEGKGAWKTRQAIEAFMGDTEDKMRLSTNDLVGCMADVRAVQKVWREEDGGDGVARSRVTKYRASSTTVESAEALKSMYN